MRVFLLNKVIIGYTEVLRLLWKTERLGMKILVSHLGRQVSSDVLIVVT